MGWNKDTEYFSGQGVLLVGLRSATGKPLGLRHVGNCPELSIKIAQNTEEHKESQSGNSATDLTIVRSTEVTTSAKIEDFDAENLAMLLQAAIKPVNEGEVVDRQVYIGRGAVTPLDHLRVSEVVVTYDSEVLTPYIDEVTPWDYEVNEDAGSIRFNKKSTKVGKTVSSITTGATTALDVTSTKDLKVGGLVRISGFTDDEGNRFNERSFKIISKTDTQIVIAADTSVNAIAVGADSIIDYDGMQATVSYSHGSFTEVEALTNNKVDLFWRFEGLNSASENYDPVVVEMFRVSSKPLQDLALISDTVQSSTIEASLLADTNRAKKNEKSAFFTIRKIGKNQ